MDERTKPVARAVAHLYYSNLHRVLFLLAGMFTYPHRVQFAVQRPDCRSTAVLSVYSCWCDATVREVLSSLAFETI